MNSLSALFEEDIQMQNDLDNMRSVTDESSDMIFSMFEDRASQKESNRVHLFENMQDRVDSELSDQDKMEIYKTILNSDDDSDISIIDINDEEI